MTEDGRHDCPKDGCPQRLPRHLLACRPHWYSIPKPLRDAVNDAWHGGHTAEYVAARQEAVDYLNRPREGATP